MSGGQYPEEKDPACKNWHRRPESFSLLKRRHNYLRKGTTMKRFVTVFLLAALGVFAIGCDSKKGTTENTTKTTVTKTENGKVVDKTETTTTDTVKTPPTAAPGAGGKSNDATK